MQLFQILSSYLVLLGLTATIAAPTFADGLIALPNGHSTSPLFNRFLQIPYFTAQLPDAGEFFVAPSFSLSQGQTNSVTLLGGSSEIINVFYDYESYSLEVPVEYGIDSTNAIGLDLQLYLYAGGFMDPLIFAFHNFFGFPQNSRDKMPYNRLLIDLPTANGFYLSVTSPRLSLADPILWYSHGLFADATTQLSLSFLGTVPLGLSDGTGGQSLPQLACALAGSWEPTTNLVLHANAGLMLPLEALASGPHPLVQFQSRTGIVFALVGDLWCGIDFTFRTSPIGDTAVPLDYGHIFNTPAIELLVSLLWHGSTGATRNGLAAFSCQEDPITHNSPDVSFIATSAFRIATQ